MNTYDEGKDGEETSIHTRGSKNKNKVFTEEEKADYLNNLRDKCKYQKSIEQQFAEAKLVPEKDKEHWAVGISGNISLALVTVSVGVIPGFDLYGSVDSSILTKSKKLSNSQALDQANLEKKC